MNVVPLHPRQRGAAEYARQLFPQPVPNFDDAGVREFVVRRQIAIECKRRKATNHDHNVAKRIAVDALREGATAAATLRAAIRYLDVVAPRTKRARAPATPA